MGEGRYTVARTVREGTIVVVRGRRVERFGKQARRPTGVFQTASQVRLLRLDGSVTVEVREAGIVTNGPVYVIVGQAGAEVQRD